MGALLLTGLFVGALTPEAVLEELVSAPQARAALIRAMDRAAASLERGHRMKQRAGLRARYREELAAHFLDQLAATPRWTLAELRRTAIEYQAFKIRTHVSSGVFPKKYFGYFDRRGDTARHERTMCRTVRVATDAANLYLEASGASFAVTDAEIAVTFIAEGGALLLADEEQDLNRIHPVLGVGLDDIASGFSQEVELVRALDGALGTELGTIVHFGAEGPRLQRYMTFDEAIAGTAVMWVFEKKIAARKLRRASRPALRERPLDAQLILSSLVYNSGLLFSEQRIEAIRTFETGAYLARVSDKNKARRWPLPVLPPRESLTQLIEHGYPQQPTSWAAVYHIFQRYGAYVALKEFTDVFDASDRLRPCAPTTAPQPPPR